MADVFPTWFGRVWLGTIVLLMALLSIRVPQSDGSAILGLQIVAFLISVIPNPLDTWWWYGVVLILPGAGAFIVRDILRRKNRIARC
jgi:hypothetical protein